jgi:hypothetical protein
VIAACVTSVAENKQEQFSYTVGPKPIISITNQYGRIRVTASSNKRVVATVLHSGTVEVQQQQSGNRIVLRSRLRNATGHETDSVDYQVLVPMDAFVMLHSSAGSLSAQNLEGDLVFEGSTASVDVLGISNAHIHVKTLNGPISLSNVLDSHVEVTTISGNVNLQDVSRSFVSVHARFRQHRARVGCDAARGTPTARCDRRTNKPASRVRDQFKQTLVGRETVRMAEADRALKEAGTAGLAKVDWLLVFSCAAFNLIRIPKLRAQGA